MSTKRRVNGPKLRGQTVKAQSEEKTRNGILRTLSVNPPRKQRMSLRQGSVTYVKSFLRAFTREKRYPTCFKFRFVSSPQVALTGHLLLSSRPGRAG
jgi:hypothetical protein